MTCLAAMTLTQGLLALACAVLAALLALAFRLRRRLHRLRRAIDRVAAGQASDRLPRYGRGALGELCRALDNMATQYDQRLRSLRSQRNELESVLTSMVEGVLAVDLDERVLSFNRAAANLLKVRGQAAVGRSIQEVVRNTAVQQFVANALIAEAPIQGDLVVRAGVDDDEHDSADRFLQAQGTALRDASGTRIGALIVLHDVTRLHRLEVIRRDFVANVSHEIKTPITAIKGSVETLIDSDGTDREGLGRFLTIISRQAERLHAIVEDLLSLARIEQDAETDRIALEHALLFDVIRHAVDSVDVQAKAKDIRLSVQCPPDLYGMMNAPMLEQAMVNLLDNAIKYSPEGTAVGVSAARRDGELLIEVTDEGVGIEPDHLPRVFERFYRTDRARSRALGGTGLGLAIVKHIAHAHEGRVSVDSRVGKGSTFRIHLPE